MIYFTTKDEKHLLIIEPRSIEKLLAGDPLVTIDDKVIVAYTPNISWTRDELVKVFNTPESTLLPEKLDEILKEGIAFHSQPQTARTDVPDTAPAPTTEPSTDQQ
jgi:hypothetical protein